MNTAIFEKIKLLPPEKQQELENFAEFLVQKYLQPEAKTDKKLLKKDEGTLET